MKKTNTAALAILVAVACLWGAAETAYVGAYDGSSHEVGPARVSSRAEAIVVQVDDMKQDLDAINAMLADRLAVESGQAPEDWSIPSMDDYERAVELGEGPFIAEPVDSMEPSDSKAPLD